MANEALAARILEMGGTGILLALGFAVALMLPVFMVMFSKRVHGGKKVFWVVVMGTVSWLGYIPYLMMTRRERGESAGSATRNDVAQ